MVIYGYCLLQGAKLLSDGSEMLLEVLDPGLIGGAQSSACHSCWPEAYTWPPRGSTGQWLSNWMRCAGLVLPILGALPDSLIIIASGLGGSAEEAQEQVHVPSSGRCTLGPALPICSRCDRCSMTNSMTNMIARILSQRGDFAAATCRWRSE